MAGKGALQLLNSLLYHGTRDLSLATPVIRPETKARLRGLWLTPDLPTAAAYAGSQGRVFSGRLPSSTDIYSELDPEGFRPWVDKIAPSTRALDWTRKTPDNTPLVIDTPWFDKEFSDKMLQRGYSSYLGRDPKADILGDIFWRHGQTDRDRLARYYSNRFRQGVPVASVLDPTAAKLSWEDLLNPGDVDYRRGGLV